MKNKYNKIWYRISTIWIVVEAINFFWVNAGLNLIPVFFARIYCANYSHLLFSMSSLLYLNSVFFPTLWSKSTEIFVSICKGTLDGSPGTRQTTRRYLSFYTLLFPKPLLFVLVLVRDGS